MLFCRQPASGSGTADTPRSTPRSGCSTATSMRATSEESLPDHARAARQRNAKFAEIPRVVVFKVSQADGGKQGLGSGGRERRDVERIRYTTVLFLGRVRPSSRVVLLGSCNHGFLQFGELSGMKNQLADSEFPKWRTRLCRARASETAPCTRNNTPPLRQ